MILKTTIPFVEKILNDIAQDLSFTAVEIGEASSHGDLKENSEYEAVKEKEHLLLLKRKRYQDYLSFPIIEEPNNFEKVTFGTFVQLYDTAQKTIIEGCVVGSAEIDLGIYPKAISISSPIAKSILGKKVGEIVTFKVGKSDKSIQILSIQSILRNTNNQNLSNLDVLIFGNIARDKIFFDNVEKSRHIAGSAFYASVGAKLFANEMGVVASIGEKDDELLNTVLNLKIPVEGIQQIKGLKSPFFEVFYDTSNPIRDVGRIVKEHIGSGNEFNFNNIPSNFLTAKTVLIGCYEPSKQLETVRFVKNNFSSIEFLAADTVEHHLEKHYGILVEIFKEVDIIFLNEREHNLIKHIQDLDKYLVVKKGSEGAELWRGANLIHHSKAMNVTLIDATGSGDVLAGAFLANLGAGKKFENSLDVAVSTASLSVTNYGVTHLIKS